jgi:sortase B
MKRGNKRWLIAFTAFTVVAAISVVVIITANVKMNRADETYSQLTEAVNTPGGNAGNGTGTSNNNIQTDPAPVENGDVSSDDGIFYIDDQPMMHIEGYDGPVPYKNLDWDELAELNPDIYAWIYVPDTCVDYPVLQHPTSNTYYLNHNIDGSAGYPGCIYTEDYNSKDFTDPNTLIYGHNMDDETMFSTLHVFRDRAMVNEDHYIYIYTPDRTFVYEIFAAYEYPSLHLILNYDYSNIYIYEQYLRNLFSVANTGARVANIKEGAEVTSDNRIVTLSTCTTDHDSTKRFLVVGVLINDEDMDPLY